MDTWAGTGVSTECGTGRLMGMCQGWNGHGLEDVWPALLIFFFFFPFSLKSENNTEIYAQACKCDWTSCNAVKMQQVFIRTNDEPM